MEAIGVRVLCTIKHGFPPVIGGTPLLSPTMLMTTFRDKAFYIPGRSYIDMNESQSIHRCIPGCLYRYTWMRGELGFSVLGFWSLLLLKIVFFSVIALKITVLYRYPSHSFQFSPFLAFGFQFLFNYETQFFWFWLFACIVQ